MPSLFHNSPVPRYAQIAGVLRQRIARGRWRAGQKLPTLPELMQEFDVARVTVRQAVELLAREGLLSAERGRGTFVTAPTPATGTLKLQTALRDLANVYRHDTPQLTLLEETAAMPALQSHEGAAAPGYRYLRRVHTRAAVAYCVIAIYLDERVFRMAAKRFRRETVVPVLLDLPRVRIAKAHQTLTIGTADVEVAEHLQLPLNAPVAEVRRIFHAPDGSVLYLGEVTYRGDYIRFDMDLNP